MNSPTIPHPSSTIGTLTRLTTAVACLSLLLASSFSAATPHDRHSRVYFESLRPSTGFNSDCDQAIFALPAPLAPDVHFDFIGLHDSSVSPGEPGNDALSLTPEDCAYSLHQAVATTTNPLFRSVNGFPDVDPRLKNRRSNEVPVPALLDGTRVALPPEGALPAPFPPTHSLPAEPMTLGEFRNVAGIMKIRCRADGTAKVRIRVSGYRPNALVTVWAVWFATPPGAPGPTIVPLPFGGVPNLLAINPRGHGVFVRELGYCPKDARQNGDQLLVIDLAEHWDGVTYGALPDEPFTQHNFLQDPLDPGSQYQSYIGGTVTLNRGVFKVRAE